MFFFFSTHQTAYVLLVLFFFQAEDGIRDRSPSRGLGDVYKRQGLQNLLQHVESSCVCRPDKAFTTHPALGAQCLMRYAYQAYVRHQTNVTALVLRSSHRFRKDRHCWGFCLLYTSDAADEEDSVDFGGRRIIKKKKKERPIVTRP